MCVTTFAGIVPYGARASNALRPLLQRDHISQDLQAAGEAGIEV